MVNIYIFKINRTIKFTLTHIYRDNIHRILRGRCAPEIFPKESTFAAIIVVFVYILTWLIRNLSNYCGIVYKLTWLIFEMEENMVPGK